MGEAALWGGSIVVMGMAATPLGAHQAGEFSPASLTNMSEKKLGMSASAGRAR